MSLLQDLKPAPASHSAKVRLGRGRGSRLGRRCGKGNKGQKARAGGGIPAGFEGGQMPMARRLPKFGFTNVMFKTTYEIVNLDQLDVFDGELTPEILKSAGLVNERKKIKILARGTLKKALNIKAHKWSAKAEELIKKAGGTITNC